MADYFENSSTDEATQDSGFVRLPQILKQIPISKSTWWAGVHTGRFPRAYKLGPGITVWDTEDIEDLKQKIRSGECK